MQAVEQWAKESLLHHNAKSGDAALELLRCLRANGGYPSTVRALCALADENADLRDALRRAQADVDAAENR